MSNCEKTFKVIEDRNKKESDRKAVKSEIAYVEKEEPIKSISQRTS